MVDIKKLRLFRYFSLTVLLLLVTTVSSFADVFNVSNAIELRDALITSQSNGEIDFINIAPCVSMINTADCPDAPSVVFAESDPVILRPKFSVNAAV